MRPAARCWICPDCRTDVCARGVTLYELLLGQSPYQATSEADLLIAVLSQDPRPPRSVDPNIPADLEAIVLKCIEKAPSAL